MIDPRLTWNVQCNAWSNMSHPPTSQNIAPATQNEASHMKRPVQCVEQHESPSNISKYCPCHKKWLSWLIFVSHETSSTMRRATGPIRQAHHKYCARHEFYNQDFNGKSRNCFRQYKDDSTTIQAWSEDNPTIKSSSRTRRFGDLIPVPSRRRILFGKIQHFALRLSLKGNAAPTMKSDSPTSLNIAPATKNDSHDWSLSEMKR